MATAEDLQVGVFFLMDEGKHIIGTQTRAGEIAKLPARDGEPWEVNAILLEGETIRNIPEVLFAHEIGSVTVVKFEDAKAVAQKLS